MKLKVNLPASIEKIEGLSGEEAAILEADVREGLSQILLSGAPDQSLEAMHCRGILSRVFPELVACDISQGSMHRYTVLVHSFKTVAAVKPELHLRLAALFHDVGKPGTCRWDGSRPRFPGHAEAGARIAASRLIELGYEPALIDKVERLVRWHMFEPGSATTIEVLERLVIRVGADQVMDLLELRRADIVACGTAIFPGTLEYLRQMAGRISGIVEGLTGKGSARIEQERGGES